MDYKKYDTSGVSPNKQQKKFQFQGNRQQLKKKNLKQKKMSIWSTEAIHKQKR